MRFKFIFLVLIFTLLKPGYCQIQNLTFKHLTTDRGLSNNTVHCVFQDSKGFMWFGTDDGLSMFNGYEFRIFNNIAADSTSLISNIVFKVTEDSKGNMWIGTDNGLDIYNRKLMVFNHIPFEKAVSSEHKYIRDIIEDDKGNIIVVTALDILIYDTNKGSLASLHKDIKEYNTLKKEGIRTYLNDRNNRIWIGSISFGLFAYDNTEKKLISNPAFREEIDIRDKIFCIIENVNGDIWIGTDNGIYVVKSDLSDIRVLRVQKNQKSISSNNIIELFTDSRERIWIGTDGGGLNLYDIKSNTFSIFEHNEYNNTSISNNSVRSIYEDKQGIIWLGTYQGGVSYTQPDRKKQFILLRNKAGNSNSLIYNAVGAIYEDREGNLWIGTDGGGLDYFNPVTGKFKHYIYDPENPNSIGGKSILTITDDKNGNIWTGGYLLGINVINIKSGKIKKYNHNPEDPNSLSNDDVRDIYKDKNDNIWIATNGGGLNRYIPETDDFYHYQSDSENTIVSNWCLKIFEDSYGYLWIGTYAGLSIFDEKNNIFNNYVQSDEPGSLSDNWVYSFAEDSLKNVWVGTSNGLNYYERKSQGFVKVIQSDILPSTTINGILTDNKHNLWLSTNKGISKLNPFDLSIRNFLVPDGLQGNQFIHGSYFKNKQGIMYFGGINGLNIFHPDSIQMNQFKPPVFLTDLLIFYKEVPINEAGSPLTQSITETEKITVTHKQSLITIKYTALNYICTEKNLYAYKLEGFDKDWNYVDSRREATFTNLNPGTYVFRVKASNNDGIWNEEGTSLKIVVLPPWWKTLVFKLSVVLFILVSTVSFYLYRIDRLKKQKVYLEKLVKKRTMEIEEKNAILTKQANELNETNTLLEERQQQIEEQTEKLEVKKEELESANIHLNELNSTKDKFFSIIAHDLKNPFNTIMGFAELLIMKFNKLSEEKKYKYSEVIYRSSKNIYDLLENLLQWSRTQTNKIAFEPSDFDIENLVQQNIALLNENIESKNISVKLGHSEKVSIYADRNMINTVIRNLLTNAIKFTDKGGQIIIDYKNKNGDVEFSIRDTGIGMTEKEISQIFRVDTNISKTGTDGETGTGLGLILCKEFIKKNGGSIWVESKSGEGSKFSFTVPASK